MEKLIQFVFDLVCAGELLMAKLLRVKVIEKAHALKMKNLIGPNLNLPCSRPIWSNPPNLLDLKSTEIGKLIYKLKIQNC
jgi:Rap guanine nucleotide exchange factor 1